MTGCRWCRGEMNGTDELTASYKGFDIEIKYVASGEGFDTMLSQKIAVKKDGEEIFIGKTLSYCPMCGERYDLRFDLNERESM